MTSQINELPKEAWIARIHPSRYEQGTAWVVVNNYRKGDYAPYLFKTEDFGQRWVRIVDDNDVKGYSLSFVQDPVEKNLLFLGTENGLWVSINEGKDWTPFKNGFPSVSTMDLVIQEKESALVVGTFGRAIWVLDDLLSLRALISNSSQKKLTALPMNEVVQVKGLFINPPGNIWSGFNTTFEGPNKVFQKVEIPLFLRVKPNEKDSIKASIYNVKGDVINTVVGYHLKKGLNYLTWKLDEEMFNLPGAWINDDSRGIPVLPGEYIVKSTYQEATSDGILKVIADPRFDIDKGVDEQLYLYQKAIKKQVKVLSGLFDKLDFWERHINSSLDKFSKLTLQDKKELKKLKKLKDELQLLKIMGKDKPLGRQVGAWQSSKITPYSATSEALKASFSRITIPSKQDWQRIYIAQDLTMTFENAINHYEKKKWTKYLKTYDVLTIE